MNFSEWKTRSVLGGSYSFLHNRVSKILHLKAGFTLKLAVFYFIGMSKKNHF
ncbi:hypothetical protein LEP1GSC062_1166 [Leptospira alexanderi serovar Manhao 3 str. L 60]|uniref:Uncharacterized protein n=1 Tax=Leptospira alexanderi serovar Manhao 3 str. L 60 TaxID=1049759 RepID=V6IEN2_9LEPT|nr:hypothetical protein LEP1GSC062_1166 [Leptospira alexanderi serovar Manhao 3 str. L 60]